jgi:hypothetical protein
MDIMTRQCAGESRPVNEPPSAYLAVFFCFMEIRRVPGIVLLVNGTRPEEADACRVQQGTALTPGAVATLFRI